MNYRIETISDLLKVPAEKRAACFLCIESAIQLHELAFGAEATSTPVRAFIWTDDGDHSVSIADSEGNDILRMDITRNDT